MDGFEGQNHVICAIFARGGSKGIPGKNLKQIKGQSLLEIAIDQAQQSKFVREVFVSTDSPEIAEVATRAGATVPFLRPAHLATDESPEWESWQHFVSQVVPKANLATTWLATMPTTAPLRNVADIDGCIQLALESQNTSGAICITKSKAHPDFNLLRKNSKSWVDIFSNEHKNSLPHRRQDSEPVWEIVPSAYCMNSQFIITSKSMWEGKLKGFEVPVERSLDIDSDFDFYLAELLFQRKQNPTVV